MQRAGRLAVAARRSILWKVAGLLGCAGYRIWAQHPGRDHCGSFFFSTSLPVMERSVGVFAKYRLPLVVDYSVAATAVESQG